MKEHKGFTLVELLAVIAILGIIMGIGAMSVVSILSHQQDTLNEEMRKNLQDAAVAYAEKHHLRLTTCQVTFDPQNKEADDANKSCYKMVQIKDIVDDGIFSDGANHCNHEEYILIYKANKGNY